MIDKNGYRFNVAIVLINNKNQVFWGKRKGDTSWQFPQGGLYENESIETAMFRELNEELGLQKEDVKIIGRTNDWLYYDVPDNYNRNNNKFYKGQKQIWYLLHLISPQDKINLSKFKEQEFDDWRWINYWAPIHLVIPFKKTVYQNALFELSKLIGLDPNQ